jgi:hypothetical protein
MIAPYHLFDTNLKDGKRNKVRSFFKKKPGHVIAKMEN